MDETTPYQGKERRRTSQLPAEITEAQISLMIEEEVNAKFDLLESEL